VLLDGKIALVSGTGPNIGSEIARTLGSQGAKLVCLDLEQKYADAAAQLVNEEGSEAIAIAADITQPADMERVVADAVRAYGGIDILVNDAAITDREPFLEAKLETWNRVLGVILTGTFVCSQQVARQMVSQERGGAIVNLVSTSGHRGETGRIAYGAAKSGLLNLTRSMAMQLAPHGIRVNSVTPTQSGTPVGRPDVAPRSDDDPPKGIPLGRWGRPKDQAQAVLFLASPMADFITGIDVPCDGGLLAAFPAG
jgi:NAD(P)-dependent dehydrogenase (short-subunit alcohol dehydrogenase family)